MSYNCTNNFDKFLMIQTLQNTKSFETIFTMSGSFSDEKYDVLKK